MSSGSIRGSQEHVSLISNVLLLSWFIYKYVQHKFLTILISYFSTNGHVFVWQRWAAATWYLRVTRGWDEQTARQRSAATQHVRDGIYDVTATNGKELSASAQKVTDNSTWGIVVWCSQISIMMNVTYELYLDMVKMHKFWLTELMKFC